MPGNLDIDEIVQLRAKGLLAARRHVNRTMRDIAGLI